MILNLMVSKIDGYIEQITHFTHKSEVYYKSL